MKAIIAAISAIASSGCAASGPGTAQQTGSQTVAAATPRLESAAQPRVAATHEANAGPIDAAMLEQIVKRLASDDFAVRESAQKELSRTEVAHLATLQRIAGETIDPELQVRLQLRINQLRQEAALRPPGISLEFHDATLQEAAASLTKATQKQFTINGTIPIAAAARVNRAGEKFTVEARDQPFWEVFMALNRQHKLNIDDIAQGRLALSENGLNQLFIFGPLAVAPMTVLRNRMASLQSPRGAEIGEEYMSLSCVFLLDPRIRIARLGRMYFSEILDDLGNNLASPPEPEVLQDPMMGQRPSARPLAVRLMIPAKRGSRIVKAKGLIHYQVYADDSLFEFHDAEKMVDEEFDLEGTQVRLQQFSVRGDKSVDMTVRLTGSGAVPVRPALLRTPSNSLPRVSLVDGADKVIYTAPVQTVLTVHIPGPILAPMKLRVTVPSVVRDLVIPFELRDIPLP